MKKRKEILEMEAKSELKERIKYAATADVKRLLEDYNNTLDGYDEKHVLIQREWYGKNIVTGPKSDSLFKRVIDAFVNPFTIVLFILVIISIFTDIIFASKGEEDYVTVTIITTMVAISGTLRLVQDIRSNKASERLRTLVKSTTTVQRKEIGRTEIPLSEVVVGDILYLSAGDMIPADVRILQAKDLFLSESSLTGESEPVEKFSNNKNNNAVTLLDFTSLAFMGSNVVSGTATCLVVAVGDDTIVGPIIHSTQNRKVVTNFEKGVNSVSWVLIRFMAYMVPVVFFINGFSKGDWVQSFLFALSVAVGLTPEMLPMIVTTNLAKGAVNMARKKTIIKNINSIQNLGAMNILCTDKTGTLTEDKIILEYHLECQHFFKQLFVGILA